MGISGLLPLLKSIQVTTHVKQYAGKVVGVDGYVWLHKGAFSCAWDLALGNHTTKYQFLFTIDVDTLTTQCTE
jgi:exonuclease-1